MKWLYKMVALITAVALMAVLLSSCSLQGILGLFKLGGSQADFGKTPESNGQSVVEAAGATGSDMSATLYLLLADGGYRDVMVRRADVTDYDDEWLCLGTRENLWYVLLYVLTEGGTQRLYEESLADSALYLTTVDDKQNLMTYCQRVEQVTDNRTLHSYDYNIFRLDEKGDAVYADRESISYYNDETNATKTAKFFEKFNQYVGKLQVLRDPFKITGKMWMDEADVTYGTVPQTDQQTDPTGATAVMPQGSKEKAGFVDNIEADSWLNLRVGPGTQYDRVLMDPKNPKSFIRQAMGSPVTILETVTTNDKKNPVWVKIKIIYKDREFVGYSSKKYIKEYEE